MKRNGVQTVVLVTLLCTAPLTWAAKSVEKPNAQATESKANACPEPAARKKFNAGIEGEISSFERDVDGRHISATITLYNKGSDSVHLMLAGPRPTAAGGGDTANLNNSSGITVCPSLLDQMLPACMGKARNYKGADLEQFTIIEPGRDISFNFEFVSNKGIRVPMLSLASTFIYRTSASSDRDSTLTEAEKRAELRTMNISFPPTPVREAK